MPGEASVSDNPMSNSNGGAEGGSSADHGGTRSDNPNPSPAQNEPTQSDTISRAEFEKVLKELHSHKKKARTYEEQLNEVKTSRMKEQNQWKELAEQREKEAQEARQQAEHLQNSYLNERKFNAVREKCAALGLRPEAMSDLELLDLEDIQIETTSTGKINILGADQFAQRLKTLKPHWFAEKQPPNVNTHSTRVVDSNGAVTPKMLLDAEREGRKAGDLSKYYELHKRFQQQRLSSVRG